MLKTKLINLPIDLAEQQKVMAGLSTTLLFTKVQDIYSSNRQKEENNLSGISTRELEMLRKEAKWKLLQEEHDIFKNDFHKQLLEENAAKEQKEVLAYRKKVYEELEGIKEEVVEHRKNHRHIVEVDNLFLLDAEMAYSIYLCMAVGVVGVAADFLAVCFDKGYGVVKNEFLAYLCMAINAKLRGGNTIEGVNNNHIPDKAKKLADECVVQIQQNAMKLGRKNINYQEAIGVSKVFDNIVKTSSGVSFEKYIIDSWIKDYAQFVVLVNSNNKIISYKEMLEERLNVGQKYIKQELYTEALNIFDELISKCIDEKSIYMNALRYKAECLYQLDKFLEALDCYNKISDLKPNEHNWGKKASCLWKMLEYEEAYEYCENGLELNSSDPLCLSVKIDCFILIKKYEEAIEYCDKLLQIKHSVATLQKKVFCLIILAKFNEASNLIGVLVNLDSKNVATLCFMIVYQYGFEQYESALSLCTTAESFNSSDKDKKKVLGHKILLLNKLTRYSEAIACINTLLVMNLNNKNSLTYKEYFSLGELMNYNQVISNLENDLKHKPHNKKVALSLALVRAIQMEKEGKNSEALENIDRALELIGDNSESKKLVVIYKAHILNIIGKYDEAIKCSDEVINLDPDYLLAWEEKAQAYNGLGEEVERRNISAMIQSIRSTKEGNRGPGEILHFPSRAKKSERFPQPETIDS